MTCFEDDVLNSRLFHDDDGVHENDRRVYIWQLVTGAPSLTMIEEIADVLGHVHVVDDECPLSPLEIYKVIQKISVSLLDDLMAMGWIIMNSWIEPDAPITDRRTIINNILFRLGRGTERLVVTTDVPLILPPGVIPNLDADEPGDNPAIITGLKTEIGKTRAAAISGYGPYADAGPGLKPPTGLPKIYTIGLDIEVSTIKRNGGMPLPHDDIISISISNGECRSDDD